MCAGWGRSGCTHDPTCPAHRRPEGDDRLLPLPFPFPMNPFSALVKESRHCPGPDSITFKEQLEGRFPAFPAPLLCCGVKQPGPGPGLVSSGGFGVYQGDACSSQRADKEAISAGNFL